MTDLHSSVPEPRWPWTLWRRAPGPVWIFLHGFTGGPSSWEPVVKHLARNGSWVGAPLVGHDRRCPVKGRTFAQIVADMASAARQDWGDEVRLVGYSMGGRVALAWALQHPEGVRSVCCIGAHAGLEDAATRQQRQAADEQWLDLLRAGDLRAFVDAWQAQAIFKHQMDLPDAVRKEQDLTRMGHDPAALAEALHALGPAVMPNYWPSLGQLAMPLLFVAGQFDAKYKTLGERMVRCASKGRLAVIAGAGHNPTLEAPKAVADLLNGC